MDNERTLERFAETSRVRFEEFSKYKFMSESDWRRGERVSSIGLFIIAFTTFIFGIYLGDLKSLLCCFTMTLCFVLCGLGLLYSPNFRVALNGGWPFDTVRQQLIGQITYLTSRSDFISIDIDAIITWGDLHARFCFALVPGVIHDPVEERELCGYYVAHYCYLRPVRKYNLERWQLLALFLVGDKLAAEEQLMKLANEIRENLLATCDSRQIEQCDDPLFLKPLNQLWIKSISDKSSTLEVVS